MNLQEVRVAAIPPERLAPFIGDERSLGLEEIGIATRDALAGRAILNVNSTGAGGGVAEMLRTLLAYARGIGVDTRWFVIRGTPAFFAITKRIHNLLYGAPGDGQPLGAEEHVRYQAVLRPNTVELLSTVRPGDIVLLHDPQVAGMASELADAGATVVWRCHIGCDTSNAHVEKAWAFLRPYLERVDAYVFSRRAFAPPWVPSDRVFCIAPSLDPFAPKNQGLEPIEVESVLRYVGLLGGRGPSAGIAFLHADGSPGRVDRLVDVLQTGPPPPSDVPLTVQISRWDPMKDMSGVMTAFAHHVATHSAAHLLLAGPVITGVADDPEGAGVLDDCIKVWRELPHAIRTRVHLACLPMRNPDENAIIVNAIQRHAAVITQKSIAEGFGLTVAEAMWKSKPVVASSVGGIVDQIVHGESGVLIDDPHDLASFGAAVRDLLNDPRRSRELGSNAHRRAQTDFLADRHLEQYAQVVAGLDRFGT